MKQLFTLATVAALTAASLSAQAQITVDGTLSAAEIGTGAGKYQLVGTYTNAHSEADRGLKALYMGTTATTLNIMVVASPEKGDYNALLLYLDAPNKTGVAANTKLAGGSDNSSQFRSQPTLDMPVDYGFRLTVSPFSATGSGDVYHSKIDFTANPTSAGKYPDVYLGSTNKTGTAFTITDANSGVLGGKISYKTSATGSVAANTTTGWEIEYPLSALGGASTNDIFRVMVAYVGDNAEFYSDVLPQISGRTTALGANPDFTAIAGTQSYSYRVGTGVLASRAASEALQVAAYPNPVAANSRLSYTVPTATAVAVNVYNSLGQKVLSLLDAAQPAGTHDLALAPLRQLPAGAYLVTLRVGSELSTRRVVVE
ncbi:T9SS type A sorting domain-containing protein [Hymenobacter chitinivorans]|uniref:Putative secreted protein (Por secretion system target) n=1 Tax=Hymenobacter chitinivorans DSM 11115 TaxID=1121954 RepID=A0A2M9BL22_9BACT|nr:T9SS type A sorting domain-containing protein [Hymenobacter chitinivorans]PJJ58656.1 putative secreted protein (Por secretion system target) [Hymenobacter chitinivorans DSM 11115]